MREALPYMVVLVVLCRGLIAGEAEETPRAPVVLEPSESDSPPAVNLSGGDDPARDPLFIGPFELIDQNGEPFSSEQLAGHPWVVSFIFTKCAGYCPTLVRDLRLEIVDRVKDSDVRYVTITVDPEYDTPERLKKYAEVFGADPKKWKFLTGDKETIYQIIQQGFRLPVVEMQGEDRRPGYEVAHSLSLLHIGPDGRVIGKYDSRNAQEVLSLRRVLNGQIEAPAENQPFAGAGEEDLMPSRQAAEEPVDQAVDAGPDDVRRLPDWAARLPSTNAMLNGLATVLLLLGLAAIKLGNVHVHKRMMLTAFGTSVAFLACYLTYHFALHHYTGTHGKSFEGTGAVRSVYFAILISHVLLAMAVPVLAIITISRGLRGQWDAHRRIAKVTFPIWLYVSVTGVIIYGMLYHWPIAV